MLCMYVYLGDCLRLLTKRFGIFQTFRLFSGHLENVETLFKRLHHILSGVRTNVRSFAKCKPVLSLGHKIRVKTLLLLLF